MPQTFKASPRLVKLFWPLLLLFGSVQADTVRCRDALACEICAVDCQVELQEMAPPFRSVTPAPARFSGELGGAEKGALHISLHQLFFA